MCHSLYRAIKPSFRAPSWKSWLEKGTFTGCPDEEQATAQIEAWSYEPKLGHMRRLNERRALPGIAVSGFGTDEDIRQTRAAGFEEHLVKPVNIAALDEAVQRVISGAVGGADAVD